MNFVELFTITNTVSTLIFLALIGIFGILLGRIKFVKIKIGIAGVLFVGLFVGHLGARVDHNVLHFVKEFGLILFVYSIGIEIGPKFIPSLKQNGLKLNILASGIVVLGFLVALLIKLIFDLDVNVIAGILSGSVTNTPSLGAIQSLITERFPNGSQLSEVSGMAYAVAYPFGIIGIILVMSLIKLFFGINVKDEVKKYKSDIKSMSGNVKTINTKVTNPNLFGKTLLFTKLVLDKEFVFSRIFRGDDYIIPDDEMIIKEGDLLVGLAEKENFDKIELKVGKISLVKDFILSGDLSIHDIVVTERKITCRKIKDINLSSLFPVNITRIFRGESEIIPSIETTLEFGDIVRVVGARNRIKEVEKYLGNSQRELSVPNILPLFIGIFLGILLGNIPIFIPGLSIPAKLGLAGGPLLISLFLGHKGRIGTFNFYMNPSANKFIRELGIVLFLACVGLGSGKYFWQTIINGGYLWMLYGALITFIPLIIIGIIAHFLKINYLTICGLLSGSMTDPPALEFANAIAPVQAQASAYATVYPLTMFLRILMAQILIIILT
jgi:putative transport protein